MQSIAVNPASVPNSATETVGGETDLTNHQTSNTAWIENDGLLRDDGAIFGTVCGCNGIDGGNALEHKLASIRNYYLKQAADRIAHATYLEEEIARLNAAREALREQEEKLRETLIAREAVVEPPSNALDPAGGSQTLRYLLGFMFNLAGCALLSLLVYDLLKESPLQYDLWVGIGIVLLASFGVAHSISILFSGRNVLRGYTHEVEHWKLHLTEWILPVSAAAFIAVWGHQEGAYLRSATVFLVLLGAFLVSGRVVLASATRLSIALIESRRKMRKARFERKESRRLMELADRLHTQITEIDRRLTTIKEELNRDRAIILRLEKQAEEKIELFCSEFELARLAFKYRQTTAFSTPPAP